MVLGTTEQALGGRKRGEDPAGREVGRKQPRPRPV
jgi:hypothetical protein